MLCDVCKCNDATVFLTQILEGKMQKVNLCDACSKEKGVQDPTGFALADLLLGIGAAEEIEKGAPTEKCPVCGFTQADFKKTGRLGCSACYVTFAEGLGSLLKAMHKGTEHVGKLPQRAHREIELSDRMRDADGGFAEGGGGRRITNRPPRCAIRSGNWRRNSRTDDEIFQCPGERRRVVARGRSASPDRDQQPRAAGAQSSASSVSGLGEEGRAHAGAGVDQAARGRAAGDAGFVFGIAPGSFRARKAGAGGAPSDQPRTGGEKRGQRGGNESAPDPQHHGERRGSPAHAIDSLRVAIEERFQIGRQSGQHFGRQTRFRLRFEARLSDRVPDQCRHRDARFRDAASARSRLERDDQSGHPGGEQDRSRGARTLRRGHGGDGESFPDLRIKRRWAKKRTRSSAASAA